MEPAINPDQLLFVPEPQFFRTDSQMMDRNDAFSTSIRTQDFTNSQSNLKESNNLKKSDNLLKINPPVLNKDKTSRSMVVITRLDEISCTESIPDSRADESEFSEVIDRKADSWIGMRSGQESHLEVRSQAHSGHAASGRSGKSRMSGIKGVKDKKNLLSNL